MLWWTDDLKTGIDKIDKDHKKIFDRAEEIMRFDENTPIEKVNVFFEFLNNYVIEHFGQEEKSMMKNLYPEFENHRQKHTELIISLFKLNKEFSKNGISSELIDNFKLLIVKWLINHIDIDDKEYAKFIRNNN